MGIAVVLMEVPTPLCFVSAWRKGVASAQRSGLTSEESVVLNVLGRPKSQCITTMPLKNQCMTTMLLKPVYDHYASRRLSKSHTAYLVGWVYGGDFPAVSHGTTPIYMLRRNSRGHIM